MQAGSTASKPKALTGRCLCGAVSFTVADAFDYAMNCHCGKCRRTTGSAFKPMGGIARAELAVTSGAGDIFLYGDATTHDAHCRHCGSLLYSQVRDAQYAHVPLGVLIDTPSIRPTHHIHVASKAPWFEITDALPQYQEFD
ncbi:MAG: GFA family protein [Hoeflea sp.]|uniref:GFA family protein n=1 Tax=Hoeflea sp. TaxID=1940281 RepID=UPI001D794E94|nr:GFA family protein [Hoeflea sp.]MBU4530009.1 GFA family protein [Alphaproteobacteria bacterium]MBU4543236.1 GFA family protein [Alphaproteobacteria bacterium]MBU4550224.1 GFA family protein [Alphaproteobacteria bacterium]MBV1722502.1 GFA family protein [Hoeflea sp.]MBV1761652.1 GFA family protein [Hoeflea sp.]